MCGIAGKLWLRPMSSAEAGRALMKRMADEMCHRGPDGGGAWVDPAAGVGLAHRRLSIIDLDPRSGQPFRDGDRPSWLTFNGEIYNYQQLRAELEATGRHQARTTGDGEVLLQYYREHGRTSPTRLLDALRGMFAFGIWDGEQQLLLLARDPLGKKPLYYCQTADGLIFGSEIKALFHDPSVPRRMNETAIQLYLTLGYIPAPFTAFEGIHKLPAGHYLIADRNGVQEPRAYWTPSFEPKHQLSEEELKPLILEKLEEATRLRMISDVPLGAFLSGGVDSSAVVAMMARNSERAVKTFSVAFDGSPQDESVYARQVAEHFGCDHTELAVDVRPEMLPTLVRYYEEPFADPAAIPTYFMSEVARQHVIVALNGDGGDENFAGYTLRHLSYSLAERLPLPAGVQRALLALASAMPSNASEAGRVYRLRKSLQILGRSNWQRNLALMETFPLQDRLTPALAGTNGHGAANGHGAHLNGQRAEHDALFGRLWRSAAIYDGLDRELYFSLALHLPEHLLVKVDRASMAWALEARSPMLDRDFVDFCARIPAAYKLKGRRGKHIFREALSGLLPDDILNRPKQGFIPPLDGWLRHELRGLVESCLLSDDSFVGGYLGAETTRSLVTEHLSGERDHQRRLYTLLVLELWERQFLRNQRF